MTESGNIVWLASYPKSGNTWFRVFLSYLLKDGENADVHINNLDGGPIASARGPFEELVGYDSGNLTHDEADLLRPEVYVRQSMDAEETTFCKIHDAYTYVSDGRALIPKEASRGAIYLVRNPLDVCVSFAHHSAYKEYDKMIDKMGDPDQAFCKTIRNQPNQLRQKLLGWSGHVKSWLDQDEIPVELLRYEDMKFDSLATFRRAVRFAGLDKTDEEIEQALENSRIDKLQQQEREHGFREKMPKAKSFFRKGKVGSWQEKLTASQIERILEDHHKMMAQLGYPTTIKELVELKD